MTSSAIYLVADTCPTCHNGERAMLETGRKIAREHDTRIIVLLPANTLYKQLEKTLPVPFYHRLDNGKQYATAEALEQSYEETESTDTGNGSDSGVSGNGSADDDRVSEDVRESQGEDSGTVRE